MDDQRLENMVGNLLRAGVLLAAVVVFAGGALYLVQHHSDHVNYRNFVAGTDSIRTLPGIIHSALLFESEGWIQLGLLLLIATPVARVGLALVGFAMEQDRLYVVVSVIVLAILLASLLRAV